MSESEKKRKTDESILEKIYKKLKYLEDDVRHLKKAKRESQDGDASRSRDEAAGQSLSVPVPQAPLVTPENLLRSFDFIACPNVESESSCQVETRSTTGDEAHENAIDEEALRILGDDPSAVAPREFVFHSDLASRWKAWICAGLDKESRAALLSEYSRVGNCPLEAPVLNPELVASLNETAVKRDRHFVDSQCLIGSAMSALGSAVTLLLTSGIYLKAFQRELYLALLVSGDDYEANMQLSSYLQPDFGWWSKNLSSGEKSIACPVYAREIFSDASLSGWGAHCKGEGTHGFWTESERALHINSLELMAAFMALKCFAADLRDSCVLLRIDNTTAISYINRMGGVQYPRLINLSKELWQWCEERGIRVFASYIKSAENVEADRQSRIQNIDTEWELADYAFQRVVNRFGPPELDLFASRANAKCALYCAWHVDPDSIACDAFTIRWDHSIFYAFPPFSLIPRVLQKLIAEEACGIVTETSTGQRPDFDCREIVRQAFVRKKLPDATLDIFIASLASSSLKQYATHLKAWWKFCARINVDPYAADKNILLAFLHEKFVTGASYGSLNSARSAISLISLDEIGKDKEVSRFFKGVFRLRPMKPKYDRTWDPGRVLNTLASHCSIEDSNLQKLSEKLATLLALGTAHRIQTLALIKIKNIKRTATGYEIEIPDLIKNSRPGQYQPLLIVPFFRDRPTICIASFLDKYLALTEPLRKEEDKLFISSRRPYKAATTQTISRWIRSILKLSGVGDTFTPHSTRHAATSAALAKGVDLNWIRSTAGWSRDSQVFARFYNRPIEPERRGFAATVFE